jgi:6-phosphogluconolactonase
VTNPNLAAVSAFTIDSGTGALQQIPGSPFPVGHGPLSLAIDTDEHFLYVANAIDNTLSVLAIDPNTGALSTAPGSPASVLVSTTTTNPHPIAVVSANGYVYVANQTSGNVSAFSIASDGTPTLITGSPFTLTSAPTLLTLDSSGKFLLEADQTNKTITEFPIDPSTGNVSAGSHSVSLGSAPGGISTSK